ncbi:dTDP-glucose 4,6-dehydratase, partial [Streptomyces xanthochromogenes]
VVRVADRKGHDLRYSLSEAKIAEELGYAPRIPFDQGLADTVAWYQDHPEWWKPLKHRAAGT